MSGSCDPSTGQRSRSPHSWSGDRTCRTGPPPLPYALLAPGARPIGSRLRLLGFTISLLVPPYLDPVLAANATAPSFLLGSGRRPGSHGYVQRVWGSSSMQLRGNSDKSLHHHPALPLSTRGLGLAPWPVGPEWGLLSRVPAPSSARRGAGPGRIQRAEKGRAERGARGRGPAGVQWARTGLAAWRAGGPLWPLPRVPGAGEAGLEVGRGLGWLSARAPGS